MVKENIFIFEAISIWCKLLNSIVRLKNGFIHFDKLKYNHIKLYRGYSYNHCKATIKAQIAPKE